MPTENEMRDAIAWAVQQTFLDDMGNHIKISKNTSQQLVDAVRSYFNQNNIQYNSFSYDDLLPFLS